MKYSSVFIATGLAITALMGTSVKADEAEDLLKQLATAAKSDNTDGSTDNLIKTVLGYYRTYIQQINTLANDGDAPAAKPDDQSASAPANTAKTTAPAIQTGQLQTGQLQTGQLQTSGPLKEAHLAGYPALQDVPPASSSTPPTAAQLREKARTDWEQTRIQMYYFEHPGHSPN